MDKKERAEGPLERVTLEEAIACIREDIRPVTETESLPLMRCLGRILAADVYASLDQPPFNRAAVDGYACRAADLLGASREKPVRLRVLGEADAGDFYDGPVGQGEAVRIMTGAPVPAACDCCIRQEDTDLGEEMVSVFAESPSQANCCRMGEDFAKGTLLLAAGTRLGAAEIGILAAAGLAKADVRRGLRIALLTAGDELAEPGNPLLPGKIYDSNRYLLGARLTELGFSPWRTESLSDDSEKAAVWMQDVAKEADLIVTAGGVSVGKRDIFHAALAKAGARRRFWRIRLKPGSPAIYSLCAGVPVVSLSGNPFAAAATFELLVRPALSFLTGDAEMMPVKREGILAEAFPKASPMRRFIRGRFDEGRVEIPVKRAGTQVGRADGKEVSVLHSSGVLTSMAGCNCLVDIPAGSGALPVGERVEVWLL